MEAVDEPARTLKWKELSGEERYRVVEMARKGEVAISELCQTFGVSRQTLYRAMAAADRASAEALELKPRGRKPKPANEVRTTELEAGNAELQQGAGALEDEVPGGADDAGSGAQAGPGRAATWRGGEKKEAAEERPDSDGRSFTRVTDEDGPEW